MTIGVPIQKFEADDVSASNPSATFAAPAAGNLLFIAITTNKNVASMTPSAGFLPCGVNIQNWACAGQFYKISDGTETGFSLTFGTQQSHNIVVWEIPFDGTPTLDTTGTGQSSTNVSTVAVTTDAPVANANSLCLGTWGHDSSDTGDSSSFDVGSELYFGGSGANANIAVGIITGRAAGPLTWTGGATTRTDQLTGAIAVFYEDGGAASVTVTDVDTDEAIAQGQNDVIWTCTLAGATQGTGRVVVSPTDDINDASAVVQAIDVWADTSVRTDNFTFPGSVAEGGTAYGFIENDAGDSNATGIILTREVQPLAFDLSGYDLVPNSITPIHASITNITLDIYDASTGDRVGARKTGLSTDANGNILSSITDAAYTATPYDIKITFQDGKKGTIYGVTPA